MKLLALFLILSGILLTLGCTTPSSSQQQYQTPTQQQYQTTTQQRVTLLDASIGISGPWSYNITGGHTYDIELNSNNPVNLDVCEVYTSTGTSSTCSNSQSLIDSTTFYSQFVYLQPKITAIMISPLSIGTTIVNLKILRIS